MHLCCAAACGNFESGTSNCIVVPRVHFLSMPFIPFLLLEIRKKETHENSAVRNIYKYSKWYFCVLRNCIVPSQCPNGIIIPLFPFYVNTSKQSRRNVAAAKYYFIVNQKDKHEFHWKEINKFYLSYVFVPFIGFSYTSRSPFFSLRIHVCLSLDIPFMNCIFGLLFCLFRFLFGIHRSTVIYTQHPIFIDTKVNIKLIH